MQQRLLLIALLFGFPLKALCGTVVLGAGISHFKTEDETIALSGSLGAIGVSLGYEMYDQSSGLYLLPEIRLAFGALDDSWSVGTTNYDAKLESYAAVGLQAGINTRNILWFLSTSYTQLEVSRDANGVGIANDKIYEIGIGGGAGYKFNQAFSVDIAYEYLGDRHDYLGLNFRLRLK